MRSDLGGKRRGSKAGLLPVLVLLTATRIRKGKVGSGRPYETSKSSFRDLYWEREKNNN